MKRARYNQRATAPLAYQLRLRLARLLYSGPTLRSKLAYCIDPRSAHFTHKRRRLGR